MSEGETRRLLREACKSMRAFQSPRELMAEIEAFLEKPAPQWTTTPPTAPGWYWVLTKGGDVIPLQASFINEGSEHQAIAFDAGTNWESYPDQYVAFMPLVPPPLPKEKP